LIMVVRGGPQPADDEMQKSLKAGLEAYRAAIERACDDLEAGRQPDAEGRRLLIATLQAIINMPSHERIALLSRNVKV
ncbi:hypothetical protein LCGC14_1549310, partial [marine sediment metagenome]